MPFLPVFLISDILLGVLIICLVMYIRFVLRHEHLLGPWRALRARHTVMACATILCLYASIGLLDSLHFRLALPSVAISSGKETTASSPAYAPEVKSVLDQALVWVLGEMVTQTEKTYSQPLAIYSFDKQTVEDSRGVAVRTWVRLSYGGRHIEKDESRWLDISLRLVYGLGLGTILWLVISFIWMECIRDRSPILPSRERIRQFAVSWYPVLLVLLGACMVLGVMFTLGSRYHLLGTNKLGQDILLLSLKSIRTALMIGTMTTLIMLPFAVILGLMAGYFRGWVDDVIQYIYTTISAVPGVLLIAAAILMVQVHIDLHPQQFTTSAERGDFRLVILCLILGITGWTGLCRLLRAEAMKLRELEFVQAAKGFGVGDFSIQLRHLLPNVMHLITISAVMDFSAMVLAEAVLSYVGVGVDPSTYSFGLMINAARLEISRDPVVWWPLMSAFLFMLILVLAANLLADAVQEVFDPRGSRDQRPIKYRRGII